MISVLQNNTTDCGAYAYDYNFKCIYLTLSHAGSFVPRFFEMQPIGQRASQAYFFSLVKKHLMSHSWLTQ